MSKQMKKPKPTLTIELDTPVESKNGSVYTELSLSEPTGGQVLNAEKHLKGASISPADLRMYSFTLVSQNSGVPFSDIRDLFPISIINEATTYLQSFIEAGQETGES
ncbi:phage tail assembly protein [Komagataeibacter sp. FNDCR2]|uniref:phage tail assembly protein n=1 Tax=Komagataeibacter sp. FNDCR2 TaxID=2878682 RepID=UPI001E310F04|nr:phage tail assembly protein [Komagataeibacter sp. FNDCR2]MCE2576025.1 phage tail assembly protein [Komagataeibacter sp. FNDCR2]